MATISAYLEDFMISHRRTPPAMSRPAYFSASSSIYDFWRWKAEGRSIDTTMPQGRRRRFLAGCATMAEAARRTPRDISICPPATVELRRRAGGARLRCAAADIISATYGHDAQRRCQVSTQMRRDATAALARQEYRVHTGRAAAMRTMRILFKRLRRDDLEYHFPAAERRYIIFRDAKGQCQPWSYDAY